MNEINPHDQSEHDASRRKFFSTAALAGAAVMAAPMAMTQSQESTQDYSNITGYTGDVIQGIPVISELKIDELEAGKTHRFWFQGASNGASQYWYVPVIVVKGKNPGKTVGMQAMIHGDEVNGVKVIQRLTSELKPETMSGTVIAAPTVNITGLLANNRNWQFTNDGGSMVDFNRVWPGKEIGTVADQHAYLLYHKLWQKNVNAFIDLHTQTRGTVYPLMLYVDPRHEPSKTIAFLVPADDIMCDDDPGTGPVEQAFVADNIASITMEIGSAKQYQPEYIDRALVGLKNIISHYGIIADPIGQTSKEAGTFIGLKMTSIRAQVGGFADILVKLGDMVTKGQLVAVQRNVFGDIIKEYHATYDGKVLSLGSDPIRESNSLLVRILYN